jgi:hypothetical protein
MIEAHYFLCTDLRFAEVAVRIPQYRCLLDLLSHSKSSLTEIVYDGGHAPYSAP